MNEKPVEEQTDRRKGRAAGQWGELVVELQWRPQDKPRFQTEGWLRANGYLPDRRTA